MNYYIASFSDETIKQHQALENGWAIVEAENIDAARNLLTSVLGKSPDGPWDLLLTTKDHYDEQRQSCHWPDFVERGLIPL